ncbi:hypothetical protein Pmani_032575 [Petrolisthes manimaculis]|uniref:Uncharacterized protein n=1 Tax=Petrolisthes manimaculis TaxID=1843537 RepID=A0AAE1NTB8_9EUCA|nr:hypothetical protein Pmani_032575 [Petrolisthes manimaculis]
MAGSVLKLRNIQVNMRLKWVLNNNAEAARLAREGQLLFGTLDTWLIHKLYKGKRSRNAWQSNSDDIPHEINLEPDVGVLQQDPVPEPFIIEDVDVIGAQVKIHSILIATPEPRQDHTYSSVSRDTTDASEPVDFGMQKSQPVDHAETQTHEMVGQ